MKKLLYSLVLTFAMGLQVAMAGTSMQGADHPAYGLVVVKAGKVITVSGETLVDATIVIRDGKIEAIGENVEYPFGGKVIDAKDMTVMPGMINPTSKVMRTGGRGNLVANATYDKDLIIKKRDLENFAAAGYTTLGVVPDGAGFPGRVMILRTAPGQNEGFVVDANGPIQMAFNNPGSDKPIIVRGFKAAKAELDKIAKAKAAWEKKQAAAKKKPAPKPTPKPKPGPKPTPKPGPKPKPTPKPTPKPKSLDEAPAPKPAPKPKGKAPVKSSGFTPPTINPVYQPLVDLMQKKPGVLAMVEFGRVNQAMYLQGMRGIVPGPAACYDHLNLVRKDYAFASSYRVFNSDNVRESPFLVFPQTDVARVAEKLGKEKALVALFPVINSHPYTRDRYNLGLQLLRAGCRPVYIPTSDSWLVYARMRERLNAMVKAGFPRAEILKTVTLYPAQMLGIDDRVGSIQEGRDANLVFLSGDPLETTSEVKKVMVEGKMVEFKKRLR